MRPWKKAELVLKNDSKNEDAYLLKGTALLLKKDINGARSWLEDAIGKTINKPDGYLLLASIYGQLGEGKKVEDILNKGIAAHAKSIPLRLALSGYSIKKQAIR